MDKAKAARKNACARCGGAGRRRQPKHFFYAISLMASGVLVFLQFPPVPWLIAMVEDAAEAVGLTSSVGTVAIWTLSGLPAIFGIAFFYAWLTRDTCTACGGSGKVAKL
jgi:hypothetical protein